jgi:hypothetical protein
MKNLLLSLSITLILACSTTSESSESSELGESDIRNELSSELKSFSQEEIVLSSEQMVSLSAELSSSSATEAQVAPLVYLPFSGVVADHSGFENLTIAKGGALVTDRFNKQNNAYSFQGDDNVQMSANSNFTKVESFSISIWVSQVDHNKDYAYVGSLAENQTTFAYVGSRKDNQNLILRVETGGNGIRWTTEKNTLSLNEFSHIVFTWDGGNKESSGNIYLNGKKLNSVFTLNQAVQNFRLGTITIGDRWENGSQGFNGILDDVRIYPSVISSEKIQSLYLENGWGG